MTSDHRRSSGTAPAGLARIRRRGCRHVPRSRRPAGSGAPRWAALPRRLPVPAHGAGDCRAPGTGRDARSGRRSVHAERRCRGEAALPGTRGARERPRRVADRCCARDHRARRRGRARADRAARAPSRRRPRSGSRRRASVCGQPHARLLVGLHGARPRGTSPGTGSRVRPAPPSAGRRWSAGGALRVDSDRLRDRRAGCFRSSSRCAVVAPRSDPIRRLGRARGSAVLVLVRPPVELPPAAAIVGSLGLAGLAAALLLAAGRIGGLWAACIAVSVLAPLALLDGGAWSTVARQDWPLLARPGRPRALPAGGRHAIDRAPHHGSVAASRRSLLGKEPRPGTLCRPARAGARPRRRPRSGNARPCATCRSDCCVGARHRGHRVVEPAGHRSRLVPGARPRARACACRPTRDCRSRRVWVPPAGAAHPQAAAPVPRASCSWTAPRARMHPECTSTASCSGGFPSSPASSGRTAPSIAGRRCCTAVASPSPR